MPKGILRIPIGLIVLCLALIDIANYGGNALNLRYDLEFYLRNLDLDMSFFLNVLCRPAGFSSVDLCEAKDRGGEEIKKICGKRGSAVL